MRTINLLLSGLLLWTFGCKTADKAAHTPAQTGIPTEKSLVWRISGNGLKQPSYLYGTIHMIPKDAFALPPAVREGLDRVKRVTFEIDMKEMTNIRSQLALVTKSFMAGGKTLKDLLPPEDYKYVKAKMAEKGLRGGPFERIKPLFLSSLIGTDEEAGGGSANITSVEMELYRITRRRRLETGGLETAAFQMSVFDSIPYAAQAKMLVESIRSADTLASGGESQIEQMLRLYRDQDINAMQMMIGDDEGGMGQYEEILLRRRNLNWISGMRRMMSEKPTLFAVGAGHLGGEYGMVHLLRKEGFRVEALSDADDH